VFSYSAFSAAALHNIILENNEALTLWSYTSQHAGSLSFEKGEIITVGAKVYKDWW
jgi:hypothetical protein